jgi:hypothetical protein
MNFRNLLLVFSAFVLTAQAHPGHDLMAHGAGHVGTSVYHWGVLFVVAVASFIAGQLVRSAVSRRIFRVTGAAALVAAATLCGFSF